MKISQRDQWDANFTRLYTTSWDYLFYLAQGRPECSSCPVCSCALLFAQIARETAGAASTRSSLRPLIFEEGKRRCKPRAVHVARSRTHIQSSSPAQAGVQYSRDVNDRTEKPRRTGCPAF